MLASGFLRSTKSNGSLRDLSTQTRMRASGLPDAVTHVARAIVQNASSFKSIGAIVMSESNKSGLGHFGKGRLEAFSDGVIAIIITIMVLELKVPHGIDVETLYKLLPIFLGYVLSFIFVAIYWNNHHHLMHAAHHVTSSVMWANLHLLFWLSLIPFATGFMAENHYATVTVVLYGIVLVMCAIAYTILVRTLLGSHEKDTAIHRAIGSDRKGKLSLAIYVAGIAASFVHPVIGIAAYTLVAVIWLVPDRRIAHALHDAS